MRDYQQRQEHAHEDTLYLVVTLAFFSTVVVAMTTIIMAGTVTAVCFLHAKHATSFPVVDGFVRDKFLTFLLPSAILNLTIVFGSMIKRMSEIKQSGGRGIAESLSARRIVNMDVSPEEKQLLNIVEELSIAAGIRRPGVYVIDDEAINGLAAGHSADDAVVAVTRGAMEQLSRHQLQGLMAHEFSHIVMRDVALSTKLVGALAGLRKLNETADWCLNVARKHGSAISPSGAILGIIGILIYPIGWLGQFFATIILFSVTRQREYLADAHAVQLTRSPHGLREALEMIANDQDVSRVTVVGSAPLRHLFFADLQGWQSQLFSTHPPIKERILRLYDGQMPDTITVENRGELSTAS